MEALTTVGTFITSFPRVGSLRCPLLLFHVHLLVFDESGAVGVALPAIQTFVGSLPGVASPVSRKVGTQPKAFIAVETVVGFLPGVDSPMGDEI